MPTSGKKVNNNEIMNILDELKKEWEKKLKENPWGFRAEMMQDPRG